MKHTSSLHLGASHLRLPIYMTLSSLTRPVTALPFSCRFAGTYRRSNTFGCRQVDQSACQQFAESAFLRARQDFDGFRPSRPPAVPQALLATLFRRMGSKTQVHFDVPQNQKWWSGETAAVVTGGQLLYDSSSQASVSPGKVLLLLLRLSTVQPTRALDGTLHAS